MKSFTKFMDSFGAILLAVIWIAPLLFAFWAATHSTSDAVSLKLFSPWTLDNFRVAWSGAPCLLCSLLLAGASQRRAPQACSLGGAGGGLSL